MRYSDLSMRYSDIFIYRSEHFRYGSYGFLMINGRVNGGGMGTVVAGGTVVACGLERVAGVQPL